MLSDRLGFQLNSFAVSKWSGLRRLLRSEKAPISKSLPFHPLRGGIELVSPSLVAGWAFHPDLLLTEVKFLVGPHLISQAPLNGHRSDVAETIGFDGSFGFQLNIPADFPLLFLDALPQIIAVSADGQDRFPLQLISDPPATTSVLSQALQPDLRGLQGHFDGLSPDGEVLSGWAWRPGSSQTTVWLQADDLPPRAVSCDQPRPDLELLGHPLCCGFCLSLSQWPEARGIRIKASFDQDGRLFLPQSSATEVRSDFEEVISDAPLTLEAEALQTRSISPVEFSAAATVDRPIDGSPVEPRSVSSISLDEHWQALEDFKLLMDHIEAKVDDLEKVQPPLRRRSARFRLWR